MKICAILLVAISLSLCASARAEEVAPKSEVTLLRAQMEEFQNDLKRLKERHQAEILALKHRIRELAEELEKQQSTREYEDEVFAWEPHEKASLDTYEAPAPTGRGLWQSFNPDISVIGDMLGQYASHENEHEHASERPDDEFIFRELELNFSGTLDPFARADVVIGIHREFEHEEHEHEEGGEEETDELEELFK